MLMVKAPYFLPLSFVAQQNGHFGPRVGLAAAEEVRFSLLADPGREAGRCRFLDAENSGKHEVRVRRRDRQK